MYGTDINIHTIYIVCMCNISYAPKIRIIMPKENRKITPK